MDNPCLNCQKKYVGCAYGCKDLEQYHHEKATEYAKNLSDIQIEVAIARIESFSSRVFLPPVIEENRIYLQHLKEERASRMSMERMC